MVAHTAGVIMVAATIMDMAMAASRAADIIKPRFFQ